MHNKVFFFKTFSVISSIQTIAVYLYVFFMARFATEQEYANYMAITYIADFSVAVGLMGINLLLLREGVSFVKRNLCSFVTISSIIFIIIYVIYTTFIKPLNIVESTLLLGIVFMNYCYQVLFALLVKFKKNDIAFFAICINFLFIIFILSLLAYLDCLTSTNTLIVRFIQLSVFFSIVLYSLIHIITPLSGVNFSSIKRCFLISKDISGSNVLGILSQYIDKFISSTLNATELAKYSVARFEIPFVGIFLNNMSLVYVNRIKRSIDNNDYKNLKICFHLFILYGWYYNLIVFSILFCNAHFIIEILFSKAYVESSHLFQIILCSYLFRIIPYTNLIIAMGLEKIVIKRIFIEVCLQIILSFLLLHFWGLLGLALSLILVLTFWSVPYNFYYFAKAIHCRILDLIPIKKMIIFFIKCFIPCFLISNCFMPNNILSFIGSIVSITIFCKKEIIYIYINTK